MLRSFVVTVSLLTCLFSVNIFASQQNFIRINIDDSKAINQHIYSRYACGPTSVLNTLLFGPGEFQSIFQNIPGATNKEKLTYIIEKYGMTPSEDYKEGIKWHPNSGMSPVDLSYFMKDVLQKKSNLKGKFLERLKHETTKQHLKRVHNYIKNSLKKGIPIIVSLRSFSPHRSSKNKGEIVWNGLGNHFVIVTGIPSSIKSYEKGFSFEYLDANGPKRATGYIYIEDIRNFTAIKGNTKQWKWLTDSAFLLVNVPSLDTLKVQDQDWYWRSIITLNYAIGALET